MLWVRKRLLATANQLEGSFQKDDSAMSRQRDVAEAQCRGSAMSRKRDVAEARCRGSAMSLKRVKLDEILLVFERELDYL